MTESIGTFIKRDGEWMIRIDASARAGDTVTVRVKGQVTTRETDKSFCITGDDGFVFLRPALDRRPQRQVRAAPTGLAGRAYAALTRLSADERHDIFDGAWGIGWHLPTIQQLSTLPAEDLRAIIDEARS